MKGLVYFGHVINKDRISIDPEKVKAITNMTVPYNTKTLRRFLGLAPKIHLACRLNYVSIELASRNLNVSWWYGV